MLAFAAALAVPSYAGTALLAAPSLHCSKGQIALRGAKHGNRLKLGPKGPVVACVTPRKVGSDLVAHFRAMKELVRGDTLATPRFRRFERKHSRGKPLNFSPLDREIENFLTKHTVAGNAAARDIRTYPFTKTVNGMTMTGHGWDVNGDYPDEVLFSGGKGIDVTGTASEGPQSRTHVSARVLHYEGSFSKACPAPGGKVAADYEYHDIVQQSKEIAGKRTVISGETRVNATAEGHVNADARLTDYSLHVEIVNERKSRVEIAGTGKVLEQAPAAVYRASLNYGGGTVEGSSHGYLLGGTVTGTASSDVKLLAGIFVAITIPQAQYALEDRLTEAQQWWYGDDNARDPNAHRPGNCVELSFDPNPLRLAPGASGTVNVTLKAKADRVEQDAKHHATPAIGTVTPDRAASGTGSPAVFTYTSPNPYDVNGQYGSFSDEAVSNRGRDDKGALAENLRTPRAYVGTVSGSHRSDGSGGDYEQQTWTATGVRFDRDPAIGDEAPAYIISAGTVNWSFDAVAAPCTESGTASLPAVGGSYAGRISFAGGTGRTKYSAGAAYARTATVTLSCPPDYTASGPYSPWPSWFDSNGVYGTNLSTANADGTLTGHVDESGSGITDHWQWSLTPLY